MIGNVAAAISKTPPVPVASGLIVFPTDAAQATLSMPMVAIFLLLFMGVPLSIVALYGGGGLKKRTDATPWACGYGYTSRMSITANAFGQPLRVFMRPLYAARTVLNAPGMVVAAYWKRAVLYAFRAESLWENYVTLPTAQGAQSLGRWFQVLQMGDIRVYCLYIVITMALLLIATIR
jgi:hydrogenase-4 component B